MGPARLADLVRGGDVKALAGAQPSDEASSQLASALLLDLLGLELTQALLGPEHDEVAEVDLQSRQCRSGSSASRTRGVSVIEWRRCLVGMRRVKQVAYRGATPDDVGISPVARSAPLGALLYCPAMPKVCHVCGKGPAFGHSRSHSMVATKRRFDPNLQGSAIDVGGTPRARVRLHALPEGRQGHQGVGPSAAVRARPFVAQALRLRAVSDPSLVRFRTVVEGALAQLEARRARGQRPERLPGRRRRHGRQHGADAARRAGGARPPRRRAGAHDRRDRARRDRQIGRARRAARRARQQRRDPLPADPRRRRGAGEPPRRAGRPGADRRRDGARRRPRVRLGARAGRGHDPHRRARDGAPHRDRARAHARDAPRRRRHRRAAGRADRRRAGARARDRRESVERGPELLPVLREAGVVDAGGYGVTVIFAGVVAALRGERAAGGRAPPRRARHAPQHESSTYRYCTNFAVTGQRPRRRAASSTRSSGSATRCSSSATRRR